MASEATMKSSPLETIKVIPFWGNDKTKGGMEPREFFKKAEVFAASKGFERGLLEKLKLPSQGAVERVDKRGRTSAEVEQRCSQFFDHVMPGRRICDY